MPVGRRDVRKLMKKQPDRDWLMTELISELEGLVADMEAIDHFVQEEKINTTAGRKRVTPLAVEEQVRLGRRGLVGVVVSDLARSDELIRTGPKGKARLRLNPKFKPNLISGSGVSAPQIREFIEMQLVPVTVESIIQHFMPHINMEWILEQQRKEVARHKGKPKYKNKDDELWRALTRHFSSVISYAVKEHGWSYELPGVEKAIITVVKGSKGRNKGRNKG